MVDHRANICKSLLPGAEMGQKKIVLITINVQSNYLIYEFSGKSLNSNVSHVANAFTY